VQAAIDKGEPRSNPRSNVFLMATIGAGSTSNPVMVRILSIRGALVEGASLPAAGTAACLRRGSLEVEGVIAWRDQMHCGIRFQSPIVVDEWVKRVGAKGQQTVDAAIADIRAGATRLPAVPFCTQSRRDQLANASIELLQISERIASMPGMSIELAEELMKLDAIAHSLKSGS
jgi:hypothetical protein